MSRTFLLTGCVMIAASVSKGQADPLTAPQFLDAFIGDWEGTATPGTPARRIALPDKKQ
ncbi:MAG: hypothetical protein OEV30_10155 [Ignavibacteria bacterium]|nr:hypothetical protein [Ignavibacteria bacterium]